ncbi:MAG: hypothetical protein LAT68_17560, partial [Cyclobacteriaceae bacterium]|nr:hypothetical protein [Cyclobacteriaceae bacterium]
MTAKITEVLDQIASALPESGARLVDLVRSPSISPDPAPSGDGTQAADWLVRDLAGLGLEARK